MITRVFLIYYLNDWFVGITLPGCTLTWPLREPTSLRPYNRSSSSWWRNSRSRGTRTSWATCWASSWYSPSITQTTPLYRWPSASSIWPTQAIDQNYFKKRLKSYLSYTGRITSINLVQPAMDEENIGNPVDTGWSWVILFGSPSLVFLQSFF